MSSLSLPKFKRYTQNLSQKYDIKLNSDNHCFEKQSLLEAPDDPSLVSHHSLQQFPSNDAETKTKVNQPPGKKVHYDYVYDQPPPQTFERFERCETLWYNSSSFNSLKKNEPVTGMCPYCYEKQITYVSAEAGLMTYSMSLLICVLGGFLGCCLIPFCVDKWKNYHHYCGCCGTLILIKTAD